MQTTATIAAPRLRAKTLPPVAAKVLNLVRGWPGLTSRELCRLGAGLQFYEVVLALVVLEKARLVKRGDRRPCEVSGRDKYTWTARS